jgi:hypothetical protein
VTYNFFESPNLVVETVDLRRGFIGSFTIFGGFMIAVYSIISFFICICQKFAQDKTLIDNLYVLNGPTRMI